MVREGTQLMILRNYEQLKIASPYVPTLSRGGDFDQNKICLAFENIRSICQPTGLELSLVVYVH